MKKQNLIIIIIFLLLIVGFYIYKFSSNENEIGEEVFEETKEVVEESEVTLEESEDKTTEIEFYEIYIHGEVYKSDIYRIPSNWTLDKLFNLAGLKASADISGFNLASLVEDNKVYYIPEKISNPSSESSLININTASKEELMKLNGIGEVIADRIIEYRNKNKFEKIEDIKNVSGIGDGMYEKIKDYITVR